MFSTTSLLVLACASAIAINADPPPNKCFQAQIGNIQSGYPVNLQSVPLNPFELNYKVTIPTIPQCIYGEVGVYANVCDTDKPPEAVFQDFNTLFVYRKGAAQFTGSVDVTVFCRNY